MAGLENYNINDPSTWGSRGDGTTKGTGFFGILPASGGRIMTDIESNEKPYNLSDHKGLEGVRSQQ